MRRGCKRLDTSTQNQKLRTKTSKISMSQRDNRQSCHSDHSLVDPETALRIDISARVSSMTRILLAVCTLTLAGCGGAAKVSTPPADPRADYQSSLDAYQACVNSNLNNVQACEDKRVQMETSERAYRGR
jgi:hypothetical protein